METKKDIQKNDRKESGAGLAAGMELENKSQQDADATHAAQENTNDSKLKDMKKNEILSMKNCHRAATVQQIANPEYGVWKFEWRGQKLGGNAFIPEYAHIASQPGFGNATVIFNNDNDMKFWEVLTWKYDINLSELWDAARRSFSATSFDPERRAAQYIREYEKLLLDDLKEIPQDEQGQYIAKFKEWVATLFAKHSRIMSAAITGPARFPTERNRKANNSYDAAVAEFQNWRERTQKAIARRVEAAKPQEQKTAEAWVRVKEDIDRFVDWNLSPTNLYNRLETVARKGEVELMQQAIDYVRELNKQRKRPIFTERHKFFKLAELATAIRQRQGATAEKENKDVPFDGGIVRYNFAEDRLQILFNEKPDAELNGKLKRSAFRWSPRFGAWQRQLTYNAEYAAEHLLNIKLR